MISNPKKNKKLIWGLGLILILGAFLRLHKIGAYATFLGDEGRDALVVFEMIKNRRPTLLGPRTSVGDLYLGPLYYYLMIVPLWLFRFHPVGPAVMVACFGVATIYLVFLLGRELFGDKAGFWAALFYAVSQPIITHTRFSWNPNPVPFFACLAILSLYRYLKQGKITWILLTGACLGALVHLHYVSLAFVLVVSVMAYFFSSPSQKKNLLGGLGAFLLVLAPIFIFEFRHQFVISKGFYRFFTQEEKLGLLPLQTLRKLTIAYRRLASHFLAADKKVLGFLASLLMIFPFRELISAWKKKTSLKILFFWLIFGLLGASLYTGDLHDHYLGFLFPVPFLLLGAFLASPKAKFIKGGILVAFLSFNLLNLDLIAADRRPNDQIRRARLVAESIVQDWDGQSFNLALISPTLDFRAMNYRYFTTILGATPEGFDNYSRIETLYVIQEQEKIPLTDRTAWEIASFGESEEVKKWRFEEFGFTVSKLKKKKEAEE
ncbi:ArnT family glycosyltransferase [Patescibacteria group bacterium]